jgi:hypothetical protein
MEVSKSLQCLALKQTDGDIRICILETAHRPLEVSWYVTCNFGCGADFAEKMIEFRIYCEIFLYKPLRSIFSTVYGAL